KRGPADNTLNVRVLAPGSPLSQERAERGVRGGYSSPDSARCIITRKPRRTIMSKSAISDRALSRRDMLIAGAAVSAGVLAPCGACAAPARPDPLVPVPIPDQAPAKEGVAEFPDTKLWYWDTGGNGTPIVLSHPASGSGLVWLYQQPAFARAGYR